MDYAQINGYWQKSTIVLIPLLTILLGVLYYSEVEISYLAILYWFHLPILMIHEFEEYVFPGGFKNFFNKKTVFALDPVQDDIPLNDALIFWINIGVWLFIIIGAIFVDQLAWIGLIFIIFNGFFNGFGHIVLFQIKQKGYNPGLVTTLILIVPFTYLVIQEILSSGVFNGLDWTLSIIGGFIVGISLPLSARIRIKQFEKENA